MKMFLFCAAFVLTTSCRFRSDSMIAQAGTLPRPDVSAGAPSLCTQLANNPDLQVFYMCELNGHFTSTNGVVALNDYRTFVRWNGPRTAQGNDGVASGILLQADILEPSHAGSVDIVYRDAVALGPVVGPHVRLEGRDCPSSLDGQASFDATPHTAATLRAYKSRIRSLMAEYEVSAASIEAVFQDQNLQLRDRALTTVSGSAGLYCRVADICGERSHSSCVGLFEGSVCSTESVTDGICIGPGSLIDCGCNPLFPGIRVDR